LQKLMSRGHRLEFLVDKTNSLNSASVTFRMQSREVARRAWWTDVKFVVAIVIFVLIFSPAICGFAWDKSGNP
jgi:vesicle-associated membrane protein 7